MNTNESEESFCCTGSVIDPDVKKILAVGCGFQTQGHNVKISDALSSTALEDINHQCPSNYFQLIFVEFSGDDY